MSSGIIDTGERIPVGPHCSFGIGIPWHDYPGMYNITTIRHMPSEAVWFRGFVEDLPPADSPVWKEPKILQYLGSREEVVAFSQVSFFGFKTLSRVREQLVRVLQEKIGWFREFKSGLLEPETQEKALRWAVESCMKAKEYERFCQLDK